MIFFFFFLFIGTSKTQAALPQCVCVQSVPESGAAA